MEARSEARKNLKIRWFYAAIFAVAVGAINGLLGGGGGMLAVPLLTYVFKLPAKKAHASAILVMLITSICSSVFYITNNAANLEFKTLGVVTGFLILGALAGTFLLKKLKGKTISFLFALIMLAAGVMMIIR